MVYSLSSITISTTHTGFGIDKQMLLRTTSTVCHRDGPGSVDLPTSLDVRSDDDLSERAAMNEPE